MAYQRGGYYYRSRREGDRVITEYLGKGPLVLAMVELGSLERERRAYERAEIRARQEAELEIDREIDALGDLARQLTRAVLVASGYHTHKRQWRRRRDDS